MPKGLNSRLTIRGHRRFTGRGPKSRIIAYKFETRKLSKLSLLSAASANTPPPTFFNCCIFGTKAPKDCCRNLPPTSCISCQFPETQPFATPLLLSRSDQKIHHVHITLNANVFPLFFRNVRGRAAQAIEVIKLLPRRISPFFCFGCILILLLGILEA